MKDKITLGWLVILAIIFSPIIIITYIVGFIADSLIDLHEFLIN